jgi:GAF domain
MEKEQTYSRPVEISSSTHQLLIDKLKEFPFKTYLSFEPLVDFFNEETRKDNSIKNSLAKNILEHYQKCTDLHGYITDISLAEKNKDLIDSMMTVIYSPAQWDTQLSASVQPFMFEYFYATPSFKKLFSPAFKKLANNSLNLIEFNLDPRVVMFGKIVKAYLLILKQLYGIDMNLNMPIITRIKDEKTGLSRYFQLILDPSFVRVKAVGKLPELKKEHIDSLLKETGNIKKWISYLPPENFEFYGFATFTAIDITEQEVISQLKDDLLEKESIISIDRFYNLQEKLRDLFKLPELKLGLAALPKDWNLMLDYGQKIGDSFILNDACNFECEIFNKSIYIRAKEAGKPIIVEDLENLKSKTEVEDALIKLGIRNIIVAPLYYEKELIGVIELASPNPGDLHSLNSMTLNTFISLFAVAVKRSMDELENKIQAVIKEQCTAIHPSVEWRFRKAAINLISKGNKEKAVEMEPIVFENVYPLYGLSDIRNSSEYRNKSIQLDLIEHLKMAKNIVISAGKAKKLHVLDEMNYIIDKHIKQIKENLKSGDEINIIEFLESEIQPVFDHLESLDTNLSEMVNQYKNTLDPELNTFYYKRKDYEKSVSLINETISNYLDECEKESQEMFPHYFEKYKTDGVEYSIYIGGSLTENKKFDLIYLKNLRLWQLMVSCGIVKQTNEIKTELKVPLETSHLILIQNSPLSIRFRLDEKKFDVDGTYNLRYEIMKKRIDKVLISKTQERLTQPGKIAIVYSQQREATEYLKYIDYLQSSGFLLPAVEDFELEDLQGVYGLKALRVTVDINSKQDKQKINSNEILKAVDKITMN